MEIICPFCEHVFEVDEYGIGECDSCKEMYNVTESTDGFDLNSWSHVVWRNLTLED